MKNLDYDLNLPVHLARRDIFFHAATGAFADKTSGNNPRKQGKMVTKALYLLKSSGEHAFLVTKVDSPGNEKTACVALLNIMHNHLLALHFILDTLCLLEKQQKRIMPFVKDSSSAISKSKKQMSTSADLLWAELGNTAKIAEKTMLASRKEHIKGMSKEERVRYVKAGKELKKYLKEKLKHPETIPSQIFYSIPGMKYE